MASKLYVGGRSYSTTSETLREYFAQCGTVESAAVITDKFSGQSRGFGFVEMATAEEAQRAISELNGKDLDGRKLTVNLSTPKAPGSGGGPRGGGGAPRGPPAGVGRRGRTSASLSAFVVVSSLVAATLPMATARPLGASMQRSSWSTYSFGSACWSRSNDTVVKPQPMMSS